MIRYLACFLIFALAVFPAWADECESYPNVPINITTRFDTPQYNFNVTIGQVQQLVGGNSRQGIPENHRGLTLGLTRYQPIVEFHIPVKSITYPDGLSCSFVEKADVTIGYRDVTVYVPQEIGRDSCGFREVLLHEQKHIEVNRRILEAFKPRIEEKVGAYLKINGVFRQPNPDYAVSLLRQKLQEILDQTSEEIFTENHKLQALVDTPQEYKRITNSCNGELSEVTRDYFQGKR